MSVRIALLGGVGGTGIGRNCLAVEDGEETVLVDFGLLFPRTRAHADQVSIPDTTYLHERCPPVAAVFLTHGHDDHVGGLPFLLGELECPVYGTALTLALARRRLVEAGFGDGQLRQVEDGEVVRTRSMAVEFVPVAHSVPMSCALAITTRAGVLLHTGDLKLDPEPVDGRITDLARFEQLGSDPGVRVLLIDSTNADEPGRTPPERTVFPALESAFADADGRRVIATCFASHLHRIAQIVDLARRHGRTVVPVGRSMERAIEIGRALGALDLADSDLASTRDLPDIPAGHVCLLCTGSQGEPDAALARMSDQRHSTVSVGRSDLVIMSSAPVPGNEQAVEELIDGLALAGAEVVHVGHSPVHVSGHAARDDLREVIQRVRPRAVIPVHGESHHLLELASLARGLPTPPDQVLVAVDGDVVEVGDHRVDVVDRFPAPHVYVSTDFAVPVDLEI